VSRFECPFWALREDVKGPWELEPQSFVDLQSYMASELIWPRTVPYTNDGWDIEDGY
jgi:hypothetical protein